MHIFIDKNYSQPFMCIIYVRASGQCTSRNYGIPSFARQCSLPRLQVTASNLVCRCQIDSCVGYCKLGISGSFVVKYIKINTLHNYSCLPYCEFQL